MNGESRAYFDMRIKRIQIDKRIKRIQTNDITLTRLCIGYSNAEETDSTICFYAMLDHMHRLPGVLINSLKANTSITSIKLSPDEDDMPSELCSAPLRMTMEDLWRKIQDLAEAMGKMPSLRRLELDTSNNHGLYSDEIAQEQSTFFSFFLTHLRQINTLRFIPCRGNFHLDMDEQSFQNQRENLHFIEFFIYIDFEFPFHDTLATEFPYLRSILIKYQREDESPGDFAFPTLFGFPYFRRKINENDMNLSYRKTNAFNNNVLSEIIIQDVYLDDEAAMNLAK